MSIKINYKKGLSKKNSSNLILFVDEKFNLSGLKKYLTISEYSYISDLLKTQDVKKEILSFDFSWNVKKFLKNTHIKKFIWIDSEIWPNWLVELKKNNIKNILANGRLSDKSYIKWKKISSFAKLMGRNYDLIFTKSEDDKKKFENLFLQDALYYGNLKFNLSLNRIYLFCSKSFINLIVFFEHKIFFELFEKSVTFSILLNLGLFLIFS